MANRTNSLAHTKWLCKYHIVIVPKYRRKVVYYEYRKDLQEIIRTLCRYKEVEIIEGHMMPDHVHLLLSIPPKTSIYDVSTLSSLLVIGTLGEIGHILT